MEEVQLKLQVIDAGVDALISTLLENRCTRDAFKNQLLILMHCKLDLSHQICHRHTDQPLSLLSSMILQDGVKTEEQPRSGVYVLQFANGMFYVGKSAHIDQRIRQHECKMVPCTAGWPRPFFEIPTLTPKLESDHESWERNETLELMQKYGIGKVRGWMYTSQDLSDEVEESIISQICEKYDCCRLCGKKGHFVSACPSTKKKKWSWLGGLKGV